MATNRSHWLKVHSKWFKNYIFVKKCILISNIAFTIPSHFIIVPYLTFSLPLGCQTVWIKIRPDILSCLIWVLTVCKSYQQMTKVIASWQRVKYRNTEQLLDTTSLLKPQLKSISFGSNFFYFAKVLATTNSEPR